MALVVLLHGSGVVAHSLPASAASPKAPGFIQRDARKYAYPLILYCFFPRQGDHSERLCCLAETLCAAGVAVIALDHQGNGRSEGDRMHCERYERYVDDVETLVDGEVTFRLIILRNM